MVRRGLVCACALVASGCFRWAPVTSLSSVQDDRVLVEEDATKRTLVHATAEGRTIEGQSGDGGERVVVDATETRVLVRRLNVPATAVIVGASVVGVAATVFAIVVVIVASSVHAVPFE